MALTEPDAGTDLGPPRTKVEPQAGGSQKITGTKIFISDGDHALAENIVQLVPARLPGGPERTNGISLFILPKVPADDDGTLGARNAVPVGAVETKMRIHGNATCVMHLDAATGSRLGEAHTGLGAIFTMVNEARLAVGVQRLGHTAPAYQTAAHHVRARLQGHAVAGAAHPGDPADPIIVHPEVRPMLMARKSIAEGARALAHWTASLNDRAARTGPNRPKPKPACRCRRSRPCSPIAHSTPECWPSKSGGAWRHRRQRHAPARPRCAERDDLRGDRRRPGARSGGPQTAAGRRSGADRLVRAGAGLHRGKRGGRIAPRRFPRPLSAEAKDLEAATGCFAARTVSPDDVRDLFGHVAIGLRWARMAKAALAGLDRGEDDAFFRAKRATGRYYMARELPATPMLLARIRSGAQPVMALDPEAFRCPNVSDSLAAFRSA